MTFCLISSLLKITINSSQQSSPGFYRLKNVSQKRIKHKVLPWQPFENGEKCGCHIPLTE